MKTFSRIMTDVDCGWKDEVGSSISSYALGLASAQEKACEKIAGLLTEAENMAKQNLSYKSNITAIQACKID